MKTTILGVGEFAATRQAGETLKTLALGSCVAVIVFNPVERIVGMDHVALPDASVNEERARLRPGYFADTGIPALLEAMQALAPSVPLRRYVVKLVGGANVMDNGHHFNIGKRNALAIKKILWQYGMGSIAEDLGGSISRTVKIDVDTGRVTVTSPGLEPWQV